MPAGLYRRTTQLTHPRVKSAVPPEGSCETARFAMSFAGLVGLMWRAQPETRLSAIDGIDVDPEPVRTPGAPLMFMLRDPDGNTVVVMEEPATK